MSTTKPAIINGELSKDAEGCNPRRLGRALCNPLELRYELYVLF